MQTQHGVFLHDEYSKCIIYSIKELLFDAQFFSAQKHFIKHVSSKSANSIIVGWFLNKLHKTLGNDLIHIHYIIFFVLFVLPHPKM